MKRHFCELHARESEYCDEDLLDDDIDDCLHTELHPQHYHHHKNVTNSSSSSSSSSITTTASQPAPIVWPQLPTPSAGSANTTTSTSSCTSATTCTGPSKPRSRIQKRPSTPPSLCSPSAVAAASILVNQCCKKCKNCYRAFNQLHNQRPNDVALRLREKSKKKQAEQQAAAAQQQQQQQQQEAEANSRKSEQSCDCEHHDQDHDTMQSADESDDGLAGGGQQTTPQSGRRNKSRTLSNGSEDTCSLKVDCKCKNCLQRQKLVEELIAEEESSKKKKAKKKKKKNLKKAETVEEEPDDYDPNDPDGKNRSGLGDTEDEDSHGHGSGGSGGGGHSHRSMNSGVVDPTSVDINAWIKVKNKYSGVGGKLGGGGGGTSKSANSSINSSTTTTSFSPAVHHHDDEMESNGFKLIGGGASGDKRKSSNLEALTRELEGLGMTDLKTPVQTNVQKAKLIAIDANMAYLRGEIHDAIHLISECIEYDPKCPVYLINRSYYHERNKDYFNALKDAEAAIRLEENTPLEEYLEYSLYRKAKALGGLERYELVEPVLNSIIKLLSHKCKNNQQVFASLVTKIDKDLLINRLKKLVAADYTLPLARLYALKYDSIQSALEALEQNCKLLEEAGQSAIDLTMHLQLIGNHLNKDGSSSSSSGARQVKLSTSMLKTSPKPVGASKPKPLPLQQTLASPTKDLWNFNELDDHFGTGAGAGANNELEGPLAALMSSSVSAESLNEEAFLAEYAADDDDDDDSEIYFSDEDEYEMLYSHPDRWHSPKDILTLNSGTDHFFTDELRDPINSKGQKALWIGNVSPHCPSNMAEHMFKKFGEVTFFKIFSNERATDVAYLLVHYNNDISPRLVMAYFKDKVVPGISKDDLPLLIRFRNKNDKEGQGDGDGVTTPPAIQTAASPAGGGTAHQVNNSGSSSSTTTHHTINFGGGSVGPNKQQINECYYWRTTGCDRERCNFKHVPAHKGIDKQSWMRRKN